MGFSEDNAARLPQVIVMIARTPSAGAHAVTASFGAANPTRTRIMATNPMAFEAVASMPAIGALVPE